MMASIQMDGFIKPFKGAGDDCDSFWQRFLVLCNIQNWDTEEKRTNHLPLLLEKDAFLVFTKNSKCRHK